MDDGNGRSVDGTPTRTATPTLPLLRPGHGHARGDSPFGPAAPSITMAALYVLALAVWLAIGDRLPGGRWFAVHLFTLGVLTNVVLTFSEHFARTVTRTKGERAAWWPAVTNLGILAVLVGLPTGRSWLLAIGGSTVTASVLAAYLRIRRMRREAIGARFAWIARTYERAHGAFVHGAVLGVLLGTSMLPGSWYGGARIAHLHVNVLGWGGLTLLATLVFFGPTMARTRIEPGADALAARLLRLAATGLSVAVVLLVLTGLGGEIGRLSRIGAALALGTYAWAAATVCFPVGRAVGRAKPTAPRPLVVAVCLWLPLVVAADVVVVATGAWRWLDAVGVAALTGVLGQAILATLTYLTPMLRGRSTNTRETIRRRLEVGTRSRAVVYQIGVVALTIGASRITELPLIAFGWVLVLATLLVTAVVALWPTHTVEPARGTAGRR